MLQVIIPGDNAKLDKKIETIEWQIEHDSNEKDRHIHKAAYKRLIEERKNRKEPLAEGPIVKILLPYFTAE